MFGEDEDRSDTRRSLLLLGVLLGVPVLGATGALGLALLSIWAG